MSSRYPELKDMTDAVSYADAAAWLAESSSIEIGAP